MINVLKKIPTKLILLSVSLLILIHVGYLIFYTYHQNINEHLTQRNLVVQKIMNIIRVSKETPAEALEDAINAFGDEETIIILDTEPHHETKIVKPTYWKISKAIPRGSWNVALSIQLQEKAWVNIDTEITSTTLDEIFVLLLEIIIAFIILFYAWSIDRFTKPLHDFQVAAERLGVDIHADTPFTENYHGSSIVRETAEAMNQLQQRIKELLDDRTEMLAAISHDLRTPITRLKLRTNMLENDEIILKNLRDLDEMDTMISEILMFARGDYTSEEKANIDLVSLCQSICDDMEDLGEQAEFNSTENRISYCARPVTLKRALSNLIGNAIKYGERVDVSLIKEGNKIIITICDQGPGIPEEELCNVFTAFHRVDSSRSRNIAGTGLGMTIARDAIHAHNGTITLRNRKRGGLEVKIILYE